MVTETIAWGCCCCCHGCPPQVPGLHLFRRGRTYDAAVHTKQHFRPPTCGVVGVTRTPTYPMLVTHQLPNFHAWDDTHHKEGRPDTKHQVQKRRGQKERVLACSIGIRVLTDLSSSKSTSATAMPVASLSAHTHTHPSQRPQFHSHRAYRVNRSGACLLHL